MEFDQFIEFAKVAYHLYLSETLSEAETVDYLWDAECDVIFFTDDQLVLEYFDEELISTIIIYSNLDVVVETDLDNQ